MIPIAIAPMLDWTDRHYRYFMRKITRHTLLYTEMVVADAIIHGNVARLLGYDHAEHPVAVQLGGSDRQKLILAAKKCAAYGYDQINLNVGCPSDRVKSGNFGACLMEQPQLVADCIKSMQDNVTIPITIKQRIGLNYAHDYDKLRDFVAIIAETGCTEFIIHARNAILKGLSPKENREIPPLKYDFVYKLKQELPHLKIMINGGIKTIDEIEEHLKHVDGVMLGREAYYNPYLFANFDNLFFNDKSSIKSREKIARSMLAYLTELKAQDIYLHHATRHMIGLYHGCPKAKIWRHTLTNEMIKTNDLETYEKLIEFMK